MMTTNHIDALDPAMLRPGRIDYRIYLGKASHAQKLELYLRFFPDVPEAVAHAFVRDSASETMAEFQGLLLALADAPNHPVGNKRETGSSMREELQPMAV